MKIQILILLLITFSFLAGCLLKNEHGQADAIRAGIITGTLSEIAVTREKSTIDPVFIYAVPDSAASSTNTTSRLYPHAEMSPDGSFTIHGVPHGNTTLLIDINQDSISDQRLCGIEVNGNGPFHSGAIRYLDRSASTDSWFFPELEAEVFQKSSVLRIQFNGFNHSSTTRKVGYRMYLFADGKMQLKEDSFAAGKSLDIPARSGTDPSSFLTATLDPLLPGSAHSASEYYVIKTVFSDGSYAGGSCCFDISGFTLPAIELLSPNGGEFLNQGTMIRWSAQDYQGNVITVDLYSKVEGGNWTLIAEDQKNDGEYDWDTSGMPSGIYSIKAIAKNSLFDYLQEDVSDSPFTIVHPLVSDGLVAWLDPSRPESLVLSGSEVVRARDLSGQGNNFSQYVIDDGMDSPSYDPAGINGLGTFRFDTYNYLSADDGSGFNSPELSIFLVVNRNSNTGYAFLIGKDNFDWGNGYGLEFNNSELGPYVYDNGPDERVSLHREVTFVVSAILTRDSFKMWVNGVLSATHTDSIEWMESGIYRYTIGNASVTSNYGIDGWVGEVFHYDRAVTDQERQDLENYLMSKWQ